MIRMRRAAPDNDADGDDGVGAFLQRELAHDHRDFECAGHLVECDLRVRRQVANFFGRVIDEALNVLGVKLRRDDPKGAFRDADVARPRRNDGRHDLTNATRASR
jgi:hypothetical protein